MFKFLRAFLFGREEKREIKPIRKQMAKDKEAKKDIDKSELAPYIDESGYEAALADYLAKEKKK